MLHPIEHRYIRNYQLMKENERRYEFRSKEDFYINQINMTTAKMEREKTCGFSTNDVYLNQISELKLKFKELSKKYDDDYEKIDNEIIKKKLIMKSMKDQIKSAKQKIELYHSDIEEMREAERVQREKVDDD